jgi:phosphoserine phosphatase RsbU/P
MPMVGNSNLAATPQPLVLDPVSGPAMGPIEIQPGQVVVVGRSSQAQVILTDESVSRRHAQVSYAGERWMLMDLASRHGTYLNSVQVQPNVAAPLKHGDMVGIGPWSLRVRIGDGEASTHITTTLSEPSPQRLERVERVAERELATVTRNRLNLLIDVAAAVGTSSTELSLAKIIARAAVDGTGFPRASVLRETGVASEVRVLCCVTPEGTLGEAGSMTPAELHAMARLASPGSGDGTASGVATPAPTAAASFADGGVVDKRSIGGPKPQLGAESFSRSLLAAAKNGEVARLTADAPMSSAQSIMSLGIQTALCAPVTVGTSVGAYLYLDARASDAGLFAGASRATTPAVTVQNDAAAFLLALAKMYGLALNNIARLELEKRQRELERDLDAAREAQKLIMPPDEGEIGGVRYAMRCRSGRYVAGDLFDVVDLGSGRVGVFLGDVAGKGISAAMLMATAQTHLSLSLRQHGDAARAVREVNHHVCAHAADSRFISLWLGVIDVAARRVEYVDAGHGLWLLRPGTGPVQRFGTNAGEGGIPLGIDESFAYSSGVLQLAAGDRLVVFSDGVVEQPGTDGTQFGFDRAIETITTSTGVRGDVDGVFDAVVRFAATDALADDTTIASVSF